MSARPTWAVFGGSFDPPHLGHVLAVAWVLAATDAERALIVPTFEHAFDKPLAPYADRVRMVRLATADLRRVEVSELERELGGKSYTFRSLEALRARHPEVGLRLVIGGDLVEEVKRWRRYDRILELAEVYVVGRSGYAASSGEAAPTLPAISSTRVRERLAVGESVTGLVPRAVARYCAERGLYRESR